jgi:hypothetical protein
MDRAVVVRMRRRASGERVDPNRTRRDAPPLNRVRDRLTTWARDHLGELQHAQPEMPLEDRAADTWEPLVAVADLAAGDWPDRARTAATAMTAAEADHEEDTSAGVRLLGDLREAFGQAEALYSTTILDRLHKLDEAPWADWYGRLLTARDLAKLLRPYGVRAKNVRETGGEPRKGYTRADLHEPWARYVPLPPLHPSQPDEPPAQPDRAPVADQQPPSATSATGPGAVADVADRPDPSATGLTSQGTDVADVAHTLGANSRSSHARTPRRVAPGSVLARNGAPELAPDPDRFSRHATTPPQDPGR